MCVHVCGRRVEVRKKEMAGNEVRKKKMEGKASCKLVVHN
jgi:hypothetical protein